MSTFAYNAEAGSWTLNMIDRDNALRAAVAESSPLRGFSALKASQRRHLRMTYDAIALTCLADHMANGVELPSPDSIAQRAVMVIEIEDHIERLRADMAAARAGTAIEYPRKGL